MGGAFLGRLLFGSDTTAVLAGSSSVTKQAALATVLVFALAAPVCQASDRQRLSFIDVSDLIGERIDSEVAEPVWGLAFSPDETQVAIGFGQHWTKDSRIASGHVVIVALSEPKTVLHRFDITGTSAFPLPGSLRWSPSGQRLAVDSRVFALEGKLICGLADEFRFAGFLSEDRTAIYNWFSPSKGFEVRRSDCTTEDAWATRGFGQLTLATCPEAGLIAVGGFSSERVPGASPLDPRPAAIDVITYPGHSTTRAWIGNADALLAGMAFADSCRVICAGKRRGDSKGYYVSCWNIEKGETTIDQTNIALTDFQSFEAVAEDWVASTVFRWSCLEGKLWDFLDMSGCVSKLRRRVVWNVRTGQELITWNPPEQKIELPGSPHKRVSQRFAFAMSPHHRLMAEGGAGRVQIYSFR